MIEYKLTAVVPVARMSGRLGSLMSWLDEAINLNIQVIIVHDAQDSATGNELRRIVDGALSRNVILVEEKFNSPGLARNSGMDIAQGEWITFWDSDDLPRPSRYLNMIANAEARQKSIALGRFQTMNLKKEIVFRESEISDMNSIFLNPGFWRMAFKSESLRNQRFSKFRMAEDQLFLAKLNLDTSQVHFEQEIIYTYEVGGDSQLTRNSKARIDLVAVTKLLQIGIKEKVVYSKFSKLIFLKLCITQLKVSNVSDRFWAFRNILAFIIKPKDASLLVSTLVRNGRTSH